MELFYQIALTNVAFDNSYKNVLRFENRAQQEAYFDTNTLFLNKEFVNFNATNLITTNIVYDIGPNESLQKMLNCNYCIVKDNSPSKTLNYYYFFVTNAKYINDKQISVQLEIDVINTYYLDLQFSDCLIEKAHLNRFVENTDGTISFDGTVDSKLFEREDIKNVAKRLTKRTKLKIDYGNEELNTWFDNNVLCWLYVYLDPTHEYKFKNWANEDVTKTLLQLEYQTKDAPTGSYEPYVNLPSNLVCVSIPILKNTGTLLNISTTTPPKNQLIYLSNLQNFFKNNENYAYVYAIKLSFIPPFSGQFDYTINDIGDLYIKLNVFGGQPRFENDSAQVVDGMINIIKQSYETLTENFNLSKQLKFNKSQLINADKNPAFNPKLLNDDYFELRVLDSSEDYFIYDAQKLNKEQIQLTVTEAFTPDTTKRYIRVKNTSGVYIDACEDNLTGVVNLNDATIILPKTTFEQMLANNKNYFLQNSLQRGQQLIGAGAGLFGGLGTMIGGVLTANPLLITAGATGIGSSINSAVNVAYSKINEGLTVDNMKNAPANIISAKGNIFFENMYSKYGVFIEEYDILPNEKQMINDYMCQYGFTVNRLGNPKEFDNIRHFYNYVRAQIENISTNLLLSNAVRARIKEIYANGVRFWNVYNNNTPSFNYDKENYERWLND